MFSNAIQNFGLAISPAATRIARFPHIVLVFGGPLGPKATTSCRQMFLHWMLVERSQVHQSLRTPEDFPDWNRFEGYSNLIDFEKDAGNLSRTIVLFSESEGSFAELGAFSMHDAIAEQLFVIIAKDHYKAPSFIANGPIKRIELANDNAICVVDTIDPKEIQNELKDIADGLETKMAMSPKSQTFDPNRERDQFLLVADLVELFGALTIGEIAQLIKAMGVDIPKKRLAAILNQLKRFQLVVLVEKMVDRYYVPPPERHWYLDYEAAPGHPAFDRPRFKLKMFPLLMQEAPRLKAYCELHKVA